MKLWSFSSVFLVLLAGFLLPALAAFNLNKVSKYEEVSFRLPSDIKRQESNPSFGIFDLPPTFPLQFSFLDQDFHLNFQLNSKAIYHESVPIVSYSASEVSVDGEIVPGSFCNVLVKSVSPWAIEGHLMHLEELYLLKAVRSPTGDWEKTVIFNDKDQEDYVDPSEVPHSCGADDGHEERLSTRGQFDKMMDGLQRDKRYVPSGTLKSFSLGVQMDCHFMESYDDDLEDATNQVTLAIAFANTKFGATNVLSLNMFLKPNSLVAEDCLACTSPISTALSQFQTWTFNRDSGEALWVKLTNCYQSGTIGLAYVRAFCSSYSNAVVSQIPGSLNYYMTFTHELGHVFGALHDQLNNTCDAGLNIMSATVIPGATNAITFSSCSNNEMRDYMADNSAEVASCILDFFPNALASVTPLTIGANVEQELTISNNGAQYVGSTRMIAFSTSSGCATSLLAPTNYTSMAITMSAGLAAGQYFICYSDDGVFYFAQNSLLKITVVAPSATSITSLSPDVRVASNPATVTATGLIPTPTATIAFSTTASCASVTTPVVFSTSTTQTFSTPAAGNYYVCYSQDGVNFVLQTRPDVRFYTIEATSTSVGNLSPSVIAINSSPVPMSTTSKIYTGSSRIGFSQVDCTPANFVGGATLGQISLTSPVFDLPINVSTAGIYKVCFSVDSGTSYVEQVLTMAFATVPDAPTSLGSTDATPSQLSLEWNAPVDNGFGPIDYFEITVAPDSAPSQTVTGNSPTTDYTFTGLTAATQYTATVKAHNVAGLGAASSTFNAVTDAATVPGAPTFSFSNNTARTLTLTWVAPVETGGQAITGYLVNITDGVESFWASVSTTSHTFTNLDPSKSYSYTIVAINSVGDGPVLAGLAATTNAAVPSAPRNLKLDSATTASLSLEWDPPASDNNSTITRYTLKLVSGETVITHNTANTSFVVLDLASETTYKVTVTATNEVGNSAPSNSLDCTTLVDLINTILTWINNNLAIFISAVVCGFLLILGLVLLLAWCVSRKKQKKLEKNFYVANSPQLYELE